MKRNAVENLIGPAAADADHIRAIVFDLDGVLIPEDDATRQVFETTCASAVATDDPRHQLLVAAVRSVARSLWQTGPA